MSDPTITPQSPPSRFILLRMVWSHRWFGLAVLIVVGLAGWQVARALLGPVVVVDPVRRDSLVQSVVASGHFETPYRVEIGSQITGIIADVVVREGERVKAGQPLIRLEDSELKGVVVQAQGALEQAQAHVRQLAEMTLPTARETLSGAQATLQDAQSTYERTARLNANGAARNCKFSMPVRGAVIMSMPRRKSHKPAQRSTRPCRVCLMPPLWRRATGF